MQVRKFNDENNLPNKAILLIDNCPAHGTQPLLSDDGDIIVMFLPPNCTALIQPMDQNPINIVKLTYRSELLKNIVAQENDSVIDLLKKHTIRDAIVLLKLAWDKLSTDKLKNSWSKIMHFDDDDFDDEDNIPLSQLNLNDSNVQFSGLVEEINMLLTRVAPDTNLTSGEILAWNADVTANENDDFEMESEEEAETASESEPDVSYAEALSFANGMIKWCMQKGKSKHIPNIVALRSDVVDTQLQSEKKQTKISSFFKRNE